MEDTRLDIDHAHAEANIIQEIARPTIEASSKTSAPPEALKALETLGDTAWIELGDQTLDAMKEQHPAYYDALMTKQSSFARLVESYVPPYIDLQEEHYVSPGARNVLAGKASPKEHEEALGSARNTAQIMVRKVVSAIESGNKNQRAHPKSENFKRAAEAITHELEEGHFVNEHPSQIASLLECSLATAEVNRLRKRISFAPGLNAEVALEKQKKFDDSQK